MKTTLETLRDRVGYNGTAIGKTPNAGSYGYMTDDVT